MSQPAIQLSALSVDVLNNETDFDEIKGEWDELLNDSNQRVYFLRWSWNRLWWKTHAPPQSRLYLVTCRDSSRHLVGLAPLYWRRISRAGVQHGEVLFLGTGIPITISEHLDLIARRGYEKQVAETIASHIIRDENVDRLWLNEIPITSIMLPHFRRVIGQHQSVRVCNRSHFIDTRVTWDDFTKSLSKSTRHNLAYYLRRLFKQHNCRFGKVEAPDQLEPAIDDLIRLHQARWQAKGEPGSFSLPGFEQFLKEAIQSSFAEGQLRLWTLGVGEQTAAVLLAFVDKGVAHYFQGGFDPAFAKDSVGTVMLGLCIRACIESEDILEFDFMGGDAAYKERWTKSGWDSVVFERLRPGVRSSLFRVYESGERAGKSFVRMVMPEAIRLARRKRMHGK